MIVQQPSAHVLVVGFVNIHTHQAEEMLEYFEHEAEVWREGDVVGPRRQRAVRAAPARRVTARA